MEDFDEQEVEELLTKFKNMINSGESNFFDSDEMELIIDELMRNFDFNNGSKAIDYAISLYPSDSFFRILKVKKLILELKLDDAEEELNEIEQMFPPTPEFYLEKVLLSRMTGEDNNTFSLLQKALKLDEEDPEIHFMLAYEYLKKRNISQALQHASFALNADESFDEQLFTYSYLFEENKQFEDAVALFSALSDRFPLLKGTWFGLGLAYSWLSDYNNAIQSYELVLSLDDTTATAHFNIANSYYELKDYSKALSHYQQAFEIDDQDYNSLTSIGDCYSMTDNQQHALDYYHKALSINPNHPEAIMGIVSILKQTDRMDEAIIFIEKAFSLSPQSFELLFSIIEYYKEDEQTEKLKNLFNITLEQVENKADFFKFFTHYCCQNELYNFGIEILLEHLHDEIADDMILYYLAAMYYLSGNIPYGNDYLKNALLMNYEEYESFLAIDSVLQSFSEINELIALYRP